MAFCPVPDLELHTNGAGMSVCLTDNKVDEIPEPDWAGLKSSKRDGVLKTP